MTHTDNDLEQIANSMGISLYQRFSVQEASLFLRISIDEVQKLIKQNRISFIQVNKNQVDFFGYQLLEHLLASVKNNPTPPVKQPETIERILKAHEVHTMTGLSRTTIWRLENKGEFPARVSLGGNRVGWRLSEINHWMGTRV